jgi:hypothetical protein
MVIKLVAVAFVALTLQIIGAEPVHAQAGNPANPADTINNPHPALPWASSRRVDYGQAIGYIEVPAQYVVIVVPVRLPDGVPPRSERQVQTIPGYVITETTTGYWYPERWTIQQLNIGGYQWARLAPEFRRK